MHSHSSRTVLYTTLGALIALSIQFAIQQFFDKAQSTSNPYITSPQGILHLVTILTFIINSINFFHGKSITLTDSTYEEALIDRPLTSVAEFFLTTLVILSFAFLAFNLTNSTGIVLIICAQRTFDLLLNILILRQLERRKSHRRGQKYWLLMNLTIPSLLLISHFYLINSPSLEFSKWNTYLSSFTDPRLAGIQIVFIITALVDFALDYCIINRKLYTLLTDSWDDLCTEWDKMQGDYGDINRRQIIGPIVAAIVRQRAVKPRYLKVLDLGAGNGAMSRYLSKVAPNRYSYILCVDKSTRLSAMNSIRCKNSPKIGRDLIVVSPESFDANRTSDFNLLRTKWGKFDCILTIFSIQDFAAHVENREVAIDLFKSAISKIHESLDKDGIWIIVVENEAGFLSSNDASLSSGRRPVSVRPNEGYTFGLGERWIINFRSSDHPKSPSSGFQITTRFYSVKYLQYLIERFKADQNQGSQLSAVPLNEISTSRIDHIEKTDWPIHIEGNTIQISEYPQNHNQPTHTSTYSQAPRFSILAYRNSSLQSDIN